MNMNTAKNISEKLIDGILLLETENTPAQIVFNYNFFLIWNHENNDYCNIKINLTPLNSDLYDINKNTEDIINTMISNFMNSKAVHGTESLIYFHAGYVYTATLTMDRVLKKNILIENPQSTKKEKNKFIDQKILSLIQDAGTNGISISAITQKTQTITKEERENILQELIDTEVIIMTYDTSKGRKKRVYFYDNE